MFRAIVVPLDGSTFAEQALPMALELARRSGAALTLVRVHQPPAMAASRSNEWDSEIRRRETQYLNDTAVQSSDLVGAVPDVALLEGRPADAICRWAHDRDAPLIVMSSHGLTGFSRYWIGSVTDSVIREARTPVLMVRSRGANEPLPTVAVHTILVPLDGSRVAEAILPHALSVACATGARLELYRVVATAQIPEVAPALEEDATGALIRQSEADLRAAAARLGDAASKVRVDVKACIADSPATSISEHARVLNCELVAMTTVASGLARLIGSVADKVIRHGPAMVLLIRPPIARSP
jgi:nucleotide-binding universal stress UspA family protein